MGWYYRTAGTTQGPIERSGLVELFRKGTLTPQIEVSEDGRAWSMAPMVPGLMEEVLGKSATAPANEPVAPNPIVAPAAPATTPSPERSAISTDLPGPGAPTPSQGEIPTPETVLDSELASAFEAPEPIDRESETEAAVPQASGPVGHIVLDPNRRLQQASRSSGTGFIKTAACGLIGLAAIVAIGLFAANKVFGIDLRPAMIDSSVSKFMIENPEIVAHLDVESILKSKALRRTGLDSNPKIPYINDAENVTLTSDSLDLTVPRFLAIVKLKRDYRAEFIANLFRDGSTSPIGKFQMHTDPGGLGGLPIAACLPEPRTLLVGSPHVLRSVLERNDYPKLSPRESKLIAAITGSSKSASIGMFLESIEGMVSKAKAGIDSQLGELDKEDRKMVDKVAGGALRMVSDLDYAVKNIKHMTVEVDLGDRVEARTEAECVNPWKAKKVVRSLKNLMAAAPSGATQLRSFESTLPVATGSTIEAAASFDPREFGDIFTAGLAARGL